jgi:hypothetical protein
MRSKEDFRSQIAHYRNDVFGRQEDIGFLDDAWANQEVNVVTVVTWAGVGKWTGWHRKRLNFPRTTTSCFI